MMNKKVAVVTGSSKGIGRAIVLGFARSKEYSGIVVNARRIEEAQSVSDEIKKSFSDWCDPIAVKADYLKRGRLHQID
jgi:glucose 1-dehydrogenase